MFAPSRTPRDVVTRLNLEVRNALKAPEVAERLAALGVEPIDELVSRIREASRFVPLERLAVP